ncbi:DUF3307 domain-containing protein [Sulfitobacter albidus]|uniref:DUF3307 domain-containing protein n=1 Tax=Sulfitobacter albidus TaxID=2829501 RepID=A0A975JFT2_9RHOB|nr:DUF3307 domain-containing protein [Sulfitobacter albidus]QUJ77470.1 DUF3307 domain-containing protein [Sulfitobacter albidus]
MVVNLSVVPEPSSRAEVPRPMTLPQMSLYTIELLIALGCAHLLADFVFQTTHMVLNKHRLPILLMHGVHVFALTALFSGGAFAVAAGIAASHVLIDWIKITLAPDTLRSYLVDQAAHFAVLLGAVMLVPQVWFFPLWPALSADMIQISLVIGGAILASLAGGPAVGHLMVRYKADAQPEGLEYAGRIIGVMERALIYLMVMIGEPAGIGFLIAAKSILRFDTVSRDQRMSEYVIIGTLASFGWALAAAFTTVATLNALGY